MCKREPERSEGSGAKLPELFSFFWYSPERNFVQVPHAPRGMVDHSGSHFYKQPDDRVYGWAMRALVITSDPPLILKAPAA